MDIRTRSIYEEIFNGPKSKRYLASLHGVTTRTIENTISKTNGDIVYDKKIKGFRFESLLPKFIPHHVLFRLLQDCINNEIIKNDLFILSKMLNDEIDISIPMIPTSTISVLSKKLIILEVAIRSNCIIKIDYVGNDRPLDTKYVAPHRIGTSGNTYYLYSSYDKRNARDIGEFRSFALNGIHDISPVEYVLDEVFFIEGISNAYGIITKEKFVILRLEGHSANYFKREGLFNKEQFEFVSEELDGSVIMRMYYNNIQEIIHLIQSWMPFIRIEGELADDIYEIIVKNTNELVKR